MLDNMSAGRMILGLGRGAGRIEFEGFRVPMDESRPRFVEAAQMMLQGLEQGYCEFDGTYYKQPRVDIRPAPFKSFKGRTYAAAVSPESSQIMAELGIGILVIPQKPWPEVDKELNSYRAVYRDTIGTEVPPPILSGWIFCDEDAGRAEEMARKYIGDYVTSVLLHYEFAGKHLETTKGYEYYGKISEKIEKYGPEGFVDFFLGLQVWGPPEQCHERIVEFSGRLGADSFNGVFSYSGMPWEEAERNLRLFSDTVRPELQRLTETGGGTAKVA
jgi:alkanesulfonate monooxygenase SsuD/methylene tetrahydromethanopterin reductase-like flavin-dependent oxidoreductase (luciferase family)